MAVRLVREVPAPNHRIESHDESGKKLAGTGTREFCDASGAFWQPAPSLPKQLGWLETGTCQLQPQTSKPGSNAEKIRKSQPRGVAQAGPIWAAGKSALNLKASCSSMVYT